eukprot:gene9084-biopygen6179
MLPKSAESASTVTDDFVPTNHATVPAHGAARAAAACCPLPPLCGPESTGCVVPKGPGEAAGEAAGLGAIANSRGGGGRRRRRRRDNAFFPS